MQQFLVFSAYLKHVYVCMRVSLYLQTHSIFFPLSFIIHCLLHNYVLVEVVFLSLSSHSLSLFFHELLKAARLFFLLFFICCCWYFYDLFLLLTFLSIDLFKKLIIQVWMKEEGERETTTTTTQFKNIWNSIKIKLNVCLLNLNLNCLFSVKRTTTDEAVVKGSSPFDSNKQSMFSRILTTILTHILHCISVYFI